MKKRHKKRSDKDIREVKKSWSRHLLIFSGFALVIFFLFNLSISGLSNSLPVNGISIALTTLLIISLVAERWIKFKHGTIYEKFYSAYLAIMLILLGVIYWISFTNNVEIGTFKNLIILSFIIVFLYSLAAINSGNKAWFIVVSYAFAVLITIIAFAFIYWTLSIFGTGYLQFNDCQIVNPAIQSDNWFYFSSVTFYALGYGDICPVLNPTRFISQIEVALGALINTLLIGFIFWKIREKSIEEEVEKKLKK